MAKCYNCGYNETTNIIDTKRLCKACYSLYEFAKEEKYSGMFLQMIRMKAATKDNWELEKIAQNLHKNFFI